MAISRKLADLFYEVRAKTSGFEADLKSAEKSTEKLGAFIKAHPVAAAGALGTALIGVAYEATKMAAEVEKGMKVVKQSVSGTAEEYRGLRNDIRQMSLEQPRSQAELAKAAGEIGRQGVKSIGELQERLGAATRLADATGADINSIVGGMDQMFDLFGDNIGSADAALGKLWATARGRAPIEEMFAALEGAAPTIQDLKLDFDTATRALAALMDKGLTAKKAGAELAEYGKQGAAGAAAIRELAASTVIATTATEDYNKAIMATRESAESSWQMTKNNLSAVLIGLGDLILPTVNKQMYNLVGILALFNGQLDKIRGDSALASLVTLGANAGRLQGPSKAYLVQAAQGAAAGANDGKLDLGKFSLADLKNMQNGLAEVLRTSDEATSRMYDGLRRQIHEAIAGAQALAETQGKATGAGVATAAQLAAQAEEAKKFKKMMDDVNKAIREAGDAVTKSLDDMREKAGDRADDLYKEIVVQPFTNAVDDVKAKAVEAIAAANQSLDPARLMRIPEIERARDATVAALESIMEAERALNALANDTLGGKTPKVQTIQALTAAAVEVETRLNSLRAQGMGKSREAKDLEEELLKLRRASADALKDVANSAAGAVKPLAETKSHLEENVEVALRLGRAFISAASAVGLIGDESAAALNDVVSLAEGVTELIASEGTSPAAWAQTIAATASLAQKAFGGETAAEKAARMKIMGDNTQAIERLTETVGALDLAISGSDILKARGQLGRFLGATSGSDAAKAPSFGSGTLAGVDDGFLKDIARQLGITIDDTMGSWRKLAEAVNAAANKLGEIGDSFSAQQRQAEAFLKIFGITDPISSLMVRAGTGRNGANRSPVWDAIFDGLDLENPAARAELRKRAQDLFKVIMSGGDSLTAEQLGGLTGDELMALIEQLIDGLNAIDGAAPKAASALGTLADALHDIDQTAEILGTSGADVLKQKIAAFAEVFPQLNGILDGLDLSKAEDIEALKEKLRELFKSFQSGAFELPDGTSLDDLASAILTLLGAATTAAGGIQSAADAIAATVNQLQSDFEVFDTPLPDQAGTLAGAYGLDLSGYDLTTPEGVAAAIAHLQGLYTAAAGDKDAQTNIREVIRALRRIPSQTSAAAGGGSGASESISARSGATSAGTSSIQNITITQADRIVGLLGTIAANTHELAIIRAALAGTRQPNLVPPSLPSTFTVGAGGQVIQVRVSITQHFYGPVNDVGAVARNTGNELLRQINAGLGGTASLAALGAGDVSR